jgi:PIN domain nuclease of toxin-antitoxin system
MTTVTVDAAKTHLSQLISQLIARVEAGEEVVILRGTEPVVRLVPVGEPAPKRVFGAIADAANEVYVSVASAWEVTTKHRLGKLPGAGPLAVDFAREIVRRGFLPLEITLVHGQDAGALPGARRDPFDRVLIAQARHEHMALVSDEAGFDGYGITRLWRGDGGSRRAPRPGRVARRGPGVRGGS